MMSAQFVPLDTRLGSPILVAQPILLVGRHPEVDVRLTSPMISRRHCCLVVVYDRILIRDLGSRHGVYINGVRVDESEVRPGDEVAIAHLIYRLELVKSRPPSEPIDFPPMPPIDLTDDELVPLDD